MSNPLDTSSGLLASLRQAVIERLLSGPPLIDPVTVPVIDGGRTDLMSAVTTALTARSGGLCLVVTTPRIEPLADHVLVVTISVQIYENPILNWGTKGSHRSPEDAGESIMGRLLFADDGKGWSPGVWTPVEFGGLQPVFSSAEQVVFELTFKTKIRVRRGEP